MMNRWNCRPKQKRGKSKRAERSIGFSPLIPAKQVHTGGNPFFISVTVIVKTCSDSLFSIGQKNCQLFVAKLRNFLDSHNRMVLY